MADAPLPGRSPGRIRTVLNVELQDERAAQMLASRLALAHRVYRSWGLSSGSDATRRLRELGAQHRRVRFRVPSGAEDREWRAAVEEFRAAGGIVDLGHQSATLEFFATEPSELWLAEQLFEVDRSEYEKRRPSRLPFRRPVTLPPRLGRVLVNLAKVRAGDPVVDPFLGTGALAAEMALVGARVTGVDLSPDMVRGAVRNFAFLGVEADAFSVEDAGAARPPAEGGQWSALVTDPPYGRASPSGHETSIELVARVLREWSTWMAPSARMALVVPSAEPLEIPGWRTELAIRHRAHRSLTREFRVLVR